MNKWITSCEDCPFASGDGMYAAKNLYCKLTGEVYQEDFYVAGVIDGWWYKGGEFPPNFCPMANGGVTFKIRKKAFKK